MIFQIDVFKGFNQNVKNFSFKRYRNIIVSEVNNSTSTYDNSNFFEIKKY